LCTPRRKNVHLTVRAVVVVFWVEDWRFCAESGGRRPIGLSHNVEHSRVVAKVPQLTKAPMTVPAFLRRVTFFERTRHILRMKAVATD
jgi:hypothetical protein